MLTTHNSPIVAIDFSTDGRYVRSTCQVRYICRDTGEITQICTFILLPEVCSLLQIHTYIMRVHFVLFFPGAFFHSRVIDQSLPCDQRLDFSNESMSEQQQC